MVIAVYIRYIDVPSIVGVPSLLPIDQVVFTYFLGTRFYFVCFLLGNSPASEIYMPTFRNTVPSS